jgi:hypothetical protein
MPVPKVLKPRKRDHPKLIELVFQFIKENPNCTKRELAQYLEDAEGLTRSLAYGIIKKAGQVWERREAEGLLPDDQAANKGG